MLNDAILVMKTVTKDGYAEKITPIEVWFMPALNRYYAKGEACFYNLGAETNVESARWRLENSPEHRELTCNKHYREFDATCH